MNNLSFALDLFGEHSVEAPKTEGIKYAGSKLKLLPYILSLAAETGAKTVLDGFAGTTRVGQAFAKSGYQVTSSDISYWSEIFGKCYLKGGQKAKYHKLIDHLNNVKPIDGWFTSTYGGEVGSEAVGKKPWQIHNTMKLDGIRAEIDKLGLDDVTKSVALASLIQALDRVDSTMGHFTSYLKDWSPRSYNHLLMRVPEIENFNKMHEIFRGDIFETLPCIETDLAYLDPPYGSNNEKMPPSRVRYASYYHVWTTVILNDQPDTFGAAARRSDSRDGVAASIFEEFRKDDDGDFIAVKAIGKLISEVQSRFVILSYSSGGRATAENLGDAIGSVGKIIKVKEIDYKRNVMAGMRWTNEWIRDAEDKNLEFLFLIDKG